MKIDLSNNLRILLKQKGMTVLQLSRATNVPNSTIQNWLGGLEPRSLSHIKTVADYFDVSVDFLVYGEQRNRGRAVLSEYEDEINAGEFEVILRRVSVKKNR